MAFNLSSEMVNTIAKITLYGDLDAASAGELRAAVENVAASKPRRLVLIMNDLEYMASAGLRTLVFARQKMGSDVDIYCVGVRDTVRETMEMTGFHNSVVLLDTYDAAEIEGL